MLFASFPFIFGFLPVVVLICIAVRKLWGPIAAQAWILLASIFFYTRSQPFNLIYTESAAADVSDILNYRPNITGNPVTPKGQRVKTATSVSNYLNPANVSIPGVSTPYGNAGRNALRGYAYYNLTTGLHKGFKLWSDSSLLEFRAEAFNVLNNVNYNAPDSNRTDSGFGAITSAQPPRQIQLALKLIF